MYPGAMRERHTHREIPCTQEPSSVALLKRRKGSDCDIHTYIHTLSHRITLSLTLSLSRFFSPLSILLSRSIFLSSTPIQRICLSLSFSDFLSLSVFLLSLPSLLAPLSHLAEQIHFLQFDTLHRELDVACSALQLLYLTHERHPESEPVRGCANQREKERLSQKLGVNQRGEKKRQAPAEREREKRIKRQTHGERREERP